MPELINSFLAPFGDPASRTWWGSLVATFAVVWLWQKIQDEKFVGWSRLGEILRHPSSMLDLQLLLGRQLIRLLVVTPTVASGWVMASHLVRRMDASYGTPTPVDLSLTVIAAMYSLTLFVFWDLSRFLLHLAMHI